MRLLLEGLGALGALATVAALYITWEQWRPGADDRPAEQNSLSPSYGPPPDRLAERPAPPDTARPMGSEPMPAEPDRRVEAASDSAPPPLVRPPLSESEEQQPTSPQSATPPLVDDSASCPTPSIVLSLQRPGGIDVRFNPVTETTQVRMFHCTGDGRFRTRFNRDGGSLEGSIGTWDNNSIRFEFGYVSTFGGRAEVRCTVYGEADGNRRYSGGLSCADDNSHTLDIPTGVIIRL